MRTKALVLTAAIGAIGLASATAEVYSVNVVGFVNINLTNGWNLISNPLKATNDVLGAIFPTLPNGSTLAQWDGNAQTFTSPATFDTDIFGGWEDPNMPIAPGAAFFISCAANTTITFVGEVRQGSLSTPLVAGFSFVGSQVPQAGGVTSVLGWTTPNNGDTIQQWNPVLQTYMSPSTYDFDIFGGWELEPNIGIAEGFIISRLVGGSWARTFQVQ